MTFPVLTAFSSCPNDTFIFHAMIHGLVPTGDLAFSPRIGDVEFLNRQAFEGVYPLTKLSSFAYLQLKERYRLMRSGAALGFGCGPLVIAPREGTDLSGARLAVPGEHTTACLLLRLWRPDLSRLFFVRFDEIIPGILSGRFDAGVIIHEGRFVYQRHDLQKIVDLGEWWEQETGLPIPLGCIALRREGFEERADEIDAVVKSSVSHALQNPEDSGDFVRRYAQEMEEAVIREHIRLYVNDFTVDMGEKGIETLRVLEEKARCAGILTSP